jgi:type IV fimbrial biogenesis protein FimT
MAARGITITELLVTLAATAVAVGLAAPTFRNLVDMHRSTAAVNHLVGTVNLARTEAILRRQTVTLCPGSGDRCLGRDQWHVGALIFIDVNGNGQIDEDDRILTALPGLRAGARVYWRSFRNRSYLQFQPRGYTQWQNGSFHYCPPDQNVQLARLVIVNAAGRTRIGADTDGDGIVNRADGDNVRCPP